MISENGKVIKKKNYFRLLLLNGVIPVIALLVMEHLMTSIVAVQVSPLVLTCVDMSYHQ